MEVNRGMEDKIETVYVIKYALTKGIYEIQARELEGGFYEHVDGPQRGFYTVSEVAFTPECAVALAREQAARKAKSLRKQLDKLLDLQQTPKWAK